jgi:hypothetical protein
MRARVAPPLERIIASWWSLNQYVSTTSKNPAPELAGAAARGVGAGEAVAAGGCAGHGDARAGFGGGVALGRVGGVGDADDALERGAQVAALLGGDAAKPFVVALGEPGQRSGACGGP